MGELKHLCKPIGKPQLIPKPLEEEYPISIYLASWDAREKRSCSWTQDLDPAFPRYSVDIPANCQATSPGSGMPSPLWCAANTVPSTTSSRQPVFPQAMPGHSPRVSRGQQFPRLGRQAAGLLTKHANWQGGQRVVHALYWGAIYLYRHSHQFWNINSCI